eukprot:365383-Chlamydomonas_euryale.AAC.4
MLGTSAYAVVRALQARCGPRQTFAIARVSTPARSHRRRRRCGAAFFMRPRCISRMTLASAVACI